MICEYMHKTSTYSDLSGFHFGSWRTVQGLTIPKGTVIGTGEDIVFLGVVDTGKFLMPYSVTSYPHQCK